MVKDLAQVILTVKLLNLQNFKSGFRKLNAVIWNSTNESHLTPVEFNIRKDSPTIKYKDSENKNAYIEYDTYNLSGTVLHVDCEEASIEYGEYPKIAKISIWVFDSEDPKKQLVTLKFHEFVQTKLVL